MKNTFDFHILNLMAFVLLTVVSATAVGAPCPSSDDIEELRTVLLGETGSNYGFFESKAWKPGGCVVLIGFLQTAILGLFTAGTGPLSSRLLAASAPFEHEVDSYSVGPALDLAAYTLTAKSTAIGLRSHRTVQLAAGGLLDTTYLRLFRRDGKALVEVLRTEIDAEGEIAGEWQPDGYRPKVRVSRSAVIIVSKKATNGLFDLIKADGSKRVVFTWNGSRYTRPKEGGWP